MKRTKSKRDAPRPKEEPKAAKDATIKEAIRRFVWLNRELIDDLAR